MPASDSDAKSADMYGITRGRFGWKVDIKRQRVSHFKQFTFNIYGGEVPALLRAQAWRDEIVRMHPPSSRVALANAMRRNNTSGIPGVQCRMGSDGQPTAWIANTYLGPGELLSKFFSVARHGAVEAKALAIAERQKQLQQMQGRHRVHPSEALMRKAPPQPLPAGCPQPVARGEVVRRSNKTGISGVNVRKDSAGRVGWWVAVTYLGGKNLQKAFSVRVHGEAQAKALAIAERQQQLARAQQMRQAQQFQGPAPTREAARSTESEMRKPQ